jgi:phage terminase small subunit
LVEEIWVNVTEAAERTGYSRFHMQKLARDNWSKPEAEREIQVKRHSNGYMLWLPTIMEYIEGLRRGPQPKRKSPKSA